MGDIPITGDVVVIGAGLAGALMAYHLAEAQLEVVVLEAKEVASGATGRGDRVAFLGTPTPYVTLAEEVGEEQARRIWEATAENLEEGARLLSLKAVPHRRSGSLRLASSTEEAYALQRSAEALETLGFAAEIEDATDLGFVAAMRTHDDLLFDPAMLTQRLLDHPRITVQDRTEVRSLEPRGEDVLIWAQGAYLRSRAVVVAAGAYAVHLHNFLAGHLRVMPIQAVDCTAEGLPEAPLVWRNGHLALQPPLEGAEHRLVAWVRGVDDAVWPLLGDGARLFCPRAKRGRLWAAWLAEGEDGLPLIGEVSPDEGLYAIAGLGGWGLSWVFTAARRLAALMIDGTEPSLLKIGRFAA